ncbi:uncharacterized protein LOC62_04G005672 [Vanrija pseudolonga]|uniref:Ubinuclein middle domain-containing protein n=1 Tax=Vanrija pseudolonga TaxID=143232 RepID=A0AAF0YCW5_9TREE|nr:hypothetical protein LOC62_04G005672 [Vanrija pseudolonga]
MTPSRADLTNLVNERNEPPIVSRSTHNDEEEEEADVTMAEGAIGVDPDEAMEEDLVVGEGDGADGDDLDGSDDDEEDDEDEDDSSGDESDDSDSSDIIAIDGPDGVASGSAAAPNVKTEPGADESTEPKKDAEGAGETVNELKPKKKKRARPRSPSEDEDLPPPPPMPTIRLEIALPADDETLDWNFIETAASAGFEGVFNAWGEDPLAGEVTPLNPVDLNGAAGEGEASTPAAATAAAPAEPRPPGFSDEEWREMQEEAKRLEAKYEEPKKKRVMTKKRKIEYDLSDPFIDDSDLGIDAPTHVARPKKEGFFVHQGALELMEGSPMKKAKAKTSRATGRAPKEQRKSLSEVLRERHGPDGSRASPILIGSDDEAGPSYIPDRRSPSPVDAPEDRYPVDRTLYKAASREEKYLPPFDEFPDEVAHRLRSLRRESSKHVWDLLNKGKFPEHLKGPLQRAGVAAFHHDLLCIPDKETTDSGYERFSEKAFVTALCSVLPYNRLTLGKLVLKLCYTQYWRWMQMCETEGLRQWKELLDPEIPIMIQQYEQAVAEHASRQEEPELAELMDDDQNKAKSTDPKRLPTITQEMKDIFRQLVENTQEMVDINKKMEDWGQKFEGQSSELNMRKLLYNKIAKLYPEGWMTSLTLSRQYTNYKRLGQGSKNSGAGGDAQQQQQQAAQ